MTLKEIPAIRLISQQIAGTKFKTAKDIVGWMGAMQSQDYTMSKWAVGARLPKSTDTLIQKALDKGEILRTHLLRPTWHLVSAENIDWMLELTSPQVKASMKSRNKELEITEALYTKSNKLLEKALADGKHLTREELVSKLEKANIAIDNNRAAHFLMQAELDGIICSGAVKDKKQTYALLSERVSKTKKLHREEALAKLAHTYFSSHCPATLKDFTWWSGLSITDARNALEMVQSDFISEKIGAETYWLTNSFSIPKKNLPLVHLLPAFDEFIISYKDRTASLLLEHHKKTISDNGLFRPVIVVNGQVTGLWKRTIKKDKVIVETDFFYPHDKAMQKLIREAAESFAGFLDLDLSD
jgi:hypothetical protein